MSSAQSFEITITEWPGRLGNNLFALKNALHVAFELNCNLRIPEHPFLTSRFILIRDEQRESVLPDGLALDAFRYNFYSPRRFHQSIGACFRRHHSAVVRELQKVFAYSAVGSADTHFSSRSSNPLVIHVRGGDVFGPEGSVNARLFQPPLSYYQSAIEAKPWSRITLVSEDQANPCVPRLLELYPSITLQSSTLEDDVATLLRASTLVCGVGSFVPMLVLISQSIQTLYYPLVAIDTGQISAPGPCFEFEAYRPDIRFHSKLLRNYSEHLFPWTNSPRQRELMVRS